MLLQKKRFLLAAPVIVVPFLCGIFYALGGGRGTAKVSSQQPLGLNTQLPGAYPDPRKAFMDKIGAYLKADQDSQRKQAYAQQDPYHPYMDTITRKPAAPRHIPAPNPKADELLRQLNQLKQSLQQPPPPPGIASPPLPPARRRLMDTPAADPQLEKLNGMLDKVLRIQHPEENRPMGGRKESAATDLVVPADSASNAIAAVIPNDQTLVTGGTIPLRLSEDITLHGIRIAAGSWLYGAVSISSDRMLVHIRSIRDGRDLYPVDLQVYDLDGLPGVHIPDVLSRDVAKESASESVSGLDLLTPDPSLSTAAANAGIQAAKTLLARKATLIKVSVRAGYQVLLKNTNNNLSKPNREQSVHLSANYEPPGFVPGGSFLERCRSEGVELKLQGIYLQDSLLWFALEWQNRSPIGYTPQYYRWVIRDRRSFKRTAQQELPVDPVYSPGRTAVGGDSTLNQWVGFRPFAPEKEKELVLEVGEKGGGRVMTLVIRPKQILNAKMIVNEKAAAAAAAHSEDQSLLHGGGVRNDQGPVEEFDFPDFQ
jgi:hypothetical protein